MRTTKSDQHLCCSLPEEYNTSTCYSRNFKTLASLCGCAGWFESYLVGNPEDRISRDLAHVIQTSPYIKGQTFGYILCIILEV